MLQSSVQGLGRGCNLTFMNIFIEKSEVSFLETVFLLPRRKRKKVLRMFAKYILTVTVARVALTKIVREKATK